ncbi:MAG: HAMP domain-containing histidine kinase, partial [Desulfobulbaceae bacterium]|nr:HAMP domain-containing histidine kinase [Desulfobulbaceae bacterium]
AMREAVTRTSNIIGGLQRFTANLIPKQNVVDVANLIRQQLALYTPIYEQQRVELQVDLANIDTIYGDRDLLAELLENLLKNSVEALESGGIVQIVLNADQKNVTLEIINNGFLLKEEEAKRIGEPYFTTKIRGSGLGLALCRRIAEAHMWNFCIYPDEHTKTFTVTLTIPLSTS